MIPLKTELTLKPMVQKAQLLGESEQRRLKLKKATQAFESIFIAQLLKSMRSTSFTEKENGFGKDIMLSMADESVSQQLAKKGMFGVGKLLYEHLNKRLESSAQPEAPAGNIKHKQMALPETPHAERPHNLVVGKTSPVVETIARPQTMSAPVKIEAKQHSESESPALDKYLGHIRAAAAETNLPEGLLRSMILRESGGDTLAVSPHGAAGLMQLMPDTAKAMGVTDCFDPKENIMGGAKYLRSLVDRFGNLKTALAAYNAGPTSVARNGGQAPFAETRKYVETILSDLSKVK
jgi:Rod binding domain-containing protein